MSTPTCTHLGLISVTELPAAIAGCEECLKIGSACIDLRGHGHLDAVARQLAGGGP